MANLLTIKKEDSETFSFIVNGNVAEEVLNNRNDLFTFGNECHFKTSNGANIIKVQKIIYSNITIYDGVTLIGSPSSVRDLFDKLTALGFFDWYKTAGGGGVNRFTQLLDTFSSYTGKSMQFLIVAENELQVTTIEFTPITKSTGLSDMPITIEPGKILAGNNTADGYIFINAPAGSAGLKQQFEYISGDQIFILGSSAQLSAVFWNGALLDDADWSQLTDILTILFPLSSGDKIKPIGII